MKKFLYIMIVLLVTGCKQRYDSPVQSPVTGYLVVDGVINSGPGAAAITLSRTTKFENKNIVYERGALVKLEGEDNSIYTFVEKTLGQYSIDNISLDPAKKYRLRITVTGGKVYLSDFENVKNNPPVDSLSWKKMDNGVQIYVNTHDPLNNTRYYQWVNDETWQIQSTFLSSLRYKITPDPVRGPQYSVVYRDSTTFSFDPTIVNCWQFNSPTSLLLGSTAKESQDIVYLPIAFIPLASIKLSVLYSLHIKQYTWSKEGYEFLEKMKKNTESNGSIFDPQPSELNGNIHCVTDASEPVIGYFNICPQQEKRIFIQSSEVIPWNYSTGCYSMLIPNISDSIVAYGVKATIPIFAAVSTPSGNIITFYAAPSECVDCTLRGTNKKPSYWP